MSQSFYITTTLPYVNAAPHIGFALEIVEADIISRYMQMMDLDVVFNTGTDEHGQKIYQNALDQGIDPQEYVDGYAAKFADLRALLNLNYTNFIRTTDKHHIKAAQEFWQKCAENGDIYKKTYETKYCVGCELEKTDSELEDGKCSLHPTKEIELINEENYFFRFSNYQEKLLELYKNNPTFVKPSSKMKEITAFVEGGLKDFSISRLKTKMPWGIPVPGDDDHVMYVWFDALVNYISTIGWPAEIETYQKNWPGVQLAGKDNLRQQSAMWQAMLMSADLPASKKILINGFISIGGQKMSKSLGNVISPNEMVEKYGVDATRFLLINLGVFAGDMDVTWDRLDTEYTSELSNGLGNLCSRVAKMCEQKGVNLSGEEIESILDSASNDTAYTTSMENFELTQGLHSAKEYISKADKRLSEVKPWTLDDTEAAAFLRKEAVPAILRIAYKLRPFMPEVSEKITMHFSENEIIMMEPLFPRI